MKDYISWFIRDDIDKVLPNLYFGEFNSKSIKAIIFTFKTDSKKYVEIFKNCNSDIKIFHPMVFYFCGKITQSKNQKWLFIFILKTNYAVVRMANI